MKLKILTPEKMVLEKDVDSVTLPGKAGQFTVLAGHDLMAAELKAGKLFFRWTDGERKPMRGDYDVSEGFAEINSSAATVFVSSARGVND
ncbi:MAG TPA: hypothetical protein PLY45_03965 [bacterium]|nr:hypothetical protein [bacterium]